MCFDRDWIVVLGSLYESNTGKLPVVQFAGFVDDDDRRGTHDE